MSWLSEVATKVASLKPTWLNPLFEAGCGFKSKFFSLLPLISLLPLHAFPVFRDHATGGSMTCAQAHPFDGTCRHSLSRDPRHS